MLQAGQKFPPELGESTGSRYYSQEPEGIWAHGSNSPGGLWQDRWGQQNVCVACSSPLLTSHQCVTSIPEPTIFSKMGAYSKEQGIMHLSLHWEASTPCSFPGLHHSYRSNVLFLFPWPSSHWTISPILPIYHCGLVLFFLIICTSAASECCSLRAKIRSWNNGEVSARSQLSSNLTLSCSLSGQADSQGQWKENKKKSNHKTQPLKIYCCLQCSYRSA